jgi:MoxR-like ATPase
MDPTAVRELAEGIRTQIGRVVVGQDETVRLLMTALLCEGHVLLEGVPGTGKTLLVKALAATLDLGFNRIQFTPDLMPGDVIGTNLFNFQSNTFTLVKGPVFTDLLLADEINRAPPKTQSALLQAMQERLVSIDGKTHALGPSFMVVATQNPIEQEGTYPLPEAQLDRFLFKLIVGYPSRDEERGMVAIHGNRTGMPDVAAFDVAKLADAAALAEVRAAVAAIRLSEPIVDYVVDLVRATRGNQSLLCGASPRSANMLAMASRAVAALEGRDFVVPDDVKAVALPALRHRVVLAPGADLEGLTSEGVLGGILEEVAAPR